MGMRTGPDFRQILDEKLEDAGFARASRQDRPAAAACRPGPRPVFLFGDLRSGFTAGPGRPVSISSASPWTPAYGARQGAQPRGAGLRAGDRPVRHLTPPQRQAFDSLRALGADSLCDNFTDAELRSVFRALARRFHPDRHPGSSDAERTHLARSFASACDAYRTLMSTVH
jgi:hypothetical protein